MDVINTLDMMDQNITFNSTAELNRWIVNQRNG